MPQHALSKWPGLERAPEKKGFAGDGFHIIHLPFLWLTLTGTLGDDGKRLDFKKQNLTWGQALGNKLESHG